jgi:thiol:disulfide interchange protein DsbA
MTSRIDRRSFIALGAAVPLLGTALLARAQPGGAPQEGADFIRVSPPVNTDSGAQVEVLEFFQYSCPHCFRFATDLETWRKRQAADVAYKRIPVVFSPQTMPHAKLYYALDALKKTDELHMRVFAAYHQDKRRLLDPKEIADFMAANGIDRAQWTAAFDSFSVVTRANRAQQTWQAYKIDGTPMIGIDGKYVTGPSVVRAQSQAGALVVMDALVDRSRRERSPAKK